MNSRLLKVLLLSITLCSVGKCTTMDINNGIPVIKINNSDIPLDYLADNIRKNSKNGCPKKGLENIGATCYMNATLQALCDPTFASDYLQCIHTNGGNLKFDNNRTENCRPAQLACEWAVVLANLFSNNKTWNQINNKQYCSVFSPNAFKNLISDNPLFAGIAANDSKDLILYILENIHDALQDKKKYTNKITAKQLSLEDSYNKFMEIFELNYNTVISKYFYSIFDSTIYCHNCQRTMHNVQNQNLIILPLEKTREYVKKNKTTPITWDDLFNCYQACDILRGQNQIYCNYCRQMSDATNSNHLITAPEILICNFNRGKAIQYDVIADNSIEYMDLRDFMLDYNASKNAKYYIQSIIQHFGQSNMGGHFVCYYRPGPLQDWCLYNDCTVSIQKSDKMKTVLKTDSKDNCKYVVILRKLNNDEIEQLKANGKKITPLKAENSVKHINLSQQYIEYKQKMGDSNIMETVVQKNSNNIPTNNNVNVLNNMNPMMPMMPNMFMGMNNMNRANGMNMGNNMNMGMNMNMNMMNGMNMNNNIRMNNMNQNQMMFNNNQRNGFMPMPFANNNQMQNQNMNIINNNMNNRNNMGNNNNINNFNQLNSKNNINN